MGVEDNDLVGLGCIRLKKGVIRGYLFGLIYFIGVGVEDGLKGVNTALLFLLYPKRYNVLMKPVN